MDKKLLPLEKDFPKRLCPHPGADSRCWAPEGASNLQVAPLWLPDVGVKEGGRRSCRPKGLQPEALRKDEGFKTSNN